MKDVKIFIAFLQNNGMSEGRQSTWGLDLCKKSLFGVKTFPSLTVDANADKLMNKVSY